MELIDLTSEELLQELDGLVAHGQPKPMPAQFAVSGVVRKGFSGEFSTLTLTANGETFLLSPQALEQATGLAGLPLRYLKQLPDELVKANFEFVLRRIQRNYKLAGLVEGDQVRAWVREDRPIISPGQFLGQCARDFAAPWQLQLMGRPFPIFRGRLCYRFTSPDFVHEFASPTPKDRHHFAVEVTLDHYGWAPAEVAAFGYRLVCQNGLLAPFKRRSRTPIYAATLQDLMVKLRKEVQRGLDFIRRQLIPRLQEAIERPLDGRASLEALTRSAPDRVRTAVARAFEDLQALGDTEYRLINALTAAANSELEPDWSRRLARLGGEVAVGLRCPSCWQRVSRPTGATAAAGF